MIQFAYPVWALFIAIAAALGLVYVTYRPSSNVFSPAKRLTLGALRFFSLLLVIFLIWKPQMKKTVRETQPPIIAVALDQSRSMTLHLSDTLNAYADVQDKLQSILGNAFELDYIGFHENVFPFDTLSFLGNETDISTVLRYASKRYTPERLAAVLLLTDGISTTGTSPSVVGNAFESPVYAMVYGDTLPTTDATVERVVHNSFVYAGNQLEIMADLTFLESDGQRPTVRILRGNEEVYRQTLDPIEGERVFRRIQTNVPSSQQEGLLNYTLEIEPMEGETYLTNNSRRFYVNVMRQKKRIRIIAGSPHPDLGAIRLALDQLEHYDVDIAIGDEASPQDADIIVLHNYKLSAAEKDYVQKQQTGVLHILGPRSDVDGLSDVIKVEVSGDFERIRPSFNSNFTSFRLDDWWMTNGGELPPLQSYFSKGTVVSGADVMASSMIQGIVTERPAIVNGTVDNLPVMVVNGLGIWQWRMYAFRETGSHNMFNQWMSSFFRYLGSVQRKERLQLFHAERMREGQSINIDARVYDAAFEPTTSAEVTLDIMQDGEVLYNYTFSPSVNKYKLNIKGLPAGTYTYEARAKLGNETFRAAGNLIVEPYEAEFVHTTARIDEMRALAKVTGGMAKTYAEVDALVEAMKGIKAKSVIKEYQKRSPLIDFWWLLLLLLLSLSVEWYLRRRAGSY